MATWPKDDSGKYLDRTAAKNFVAVSGTASRPQPPRSLTAQSGSRKVVVTWEMPQVFNDIVGFKVYKDTENSLLDTIRDPNVRQYNIPASAGSSPPAINVFISAFNRAGVESAKIQVQGSATAEAGAPTDPALPPGSSASGDTGITGDASSGFIRGGVNQGDIG